VTHETSSNECDHESSCQRLRLELSRLDSLDNPSGLHLAAKPRASAGNPGRTRGQS
jgi:hypothetical protein